MYQISPARCVLSCRILWSHILEEASQNSWDSAATTEPCLPASLKPWTSAINHRYVILELLRLPELLSHLIATCVVNSRSTSRTMNGLFVRIYLLLVRDYCSIKVIKLTSSAMVTNRSDTRLFADRSWYLFSIFHLSVHHWNLFLVQWDSDSCYFYHYPPFLEHLHTISCLHRA